MIFRSTLGFQFSSSVTKTIIYNRRIKLNITQYFNRCLEISIISFAVVKIHVFDLRKYRKHVLSTLLH
jgi:hypothetical protein